MNKPVVILMVMMGISACNPPSAPQNASAPKASKVAVPKRTVLFFGNSLTAGYGLDDPEKAFPGLIRKKIDSLQLPYTVVSAGLSGETTAGGKSRIDWLLKNPVDVFVLELGANDGLRGLPVSATTANLQTIIDHVKAKNPKVSILLLGMEVPPNMGNAYVTEFRTVFRRLAEKNNVGFVPFFLDGVAGVTALNQRDGIHPTAAGHRICAENIWKELVKFL